MSEKVKRYTVVLIGIFLLAFSFTIFQAPNNFASGGVSGLAVIIHKVLNINESSFIFIINMFLLLLSYQQFGKEATKNTIIGSILYPIIIELTSYLSQFIILENFDLLLIAVIAGIISGIGGGLVYKNGFTTGGTDILNLFLEKKLKIPMDKAILTIDGIIVLTSAIIFGIPTMIYSLITLVISSYISNRTLLEQYQNKVFYIHTKKVTAIKDYLINNFSYDVTILNSIGGYTKKNQKIIMCSVKTKDYYIIKEGILYIDPDSFIIITDSYEQKNANKTIHQHKINTQDIKVLK